MTETELIRKIRELRQIKPRKDWVVLTKSQIFQEQPIVRYPISNILIRVGDFLFGRKLALATVFSIFILFGVFSFARNSLPGDLLYPIKKITEMSQAVFVSEEGKPRLELEFANKRLEELNLIAQNNEVRRLAPAINEFQTNISQAAKNLVKLKKIDKEIVAQTRKIEENKEKVEKVLATKIETKDYDNVLAQLVESQIKELEGKTLSDEQQIILEAAKRDLEEGNYSEALTKILILSQQ